MLFLCTVKEVKISDFLRTLSVYDYLRNACGCLDVDKFCSIFFLYKVSHMLNVYTLVYASSAKRQLTSFAIIVFRPG